MAGSAPSRVFLSKQAAELQTKGNVSTSLNALVNSEFLGEAPTVIRPYSLPAVKLLALHDHHKR
jgi:hypothetical protein